MTLSFLPEMSRSTVRGGGQLADRGGRLIFRRVGGELPIIAVNPHYLFSNSPPTGWRRAAQAGIRPDDVDRPPEADRDSFQDASTPAVAAGVL